MQAARGAARCAAPSGAAFAPSVPAGRIQPSASISAPCSTRCRSRARRGDEAVARAADGPDAARGSPGDEGVSLDDAATLLTRVESDLQRFKAFEAQNEAGIERLAGIVVPGTVPPTAGAGAPVAGGSPLLSPEQLARVWKEKQSALDELERQADLLELELAERERKLQLLLRRLRDQAAANAASGGGMDDSTEMAQTKAAISELLSAPPPSVAQPAPDSVPPAVPGADAAAHAHVEASPSPLPPVGVEAGAYEAPDAVPSPAVQLEPTGAFEDGQPEPAGAVEEERSVASGRRRSTDAARMHAVYKAHARKRTQRKNLTSALKFSAKYRAALAARTVVAVPRSADADGVTGDAPLPDAAAVDTPAVVESAADVGVGLAVSFPSSASRVPAAQAARMHAVYKAHDAKRKQRKTSTAALMSLTKFRKAPATASSQLALVPAAPAVEVPESAPVSQPPAAGGDGAHSAALTAAAHTELHLQLQAQWEVAARVAEELASAQAQGAAAAAVASLADAAAGQDTATPRSAAASVTAAPTDDVAAAALVPSTDTSLAAEAARIAHLGPTTSAARALLDMPLERRVAVLASLDSVSCTAALKALLACDAVAHATTATELLARRTAAAALSARLQLFLRRVRTSLLRMRSVLITDRKAAKRLSALPPSERAASLAALSADRAAGILGAMDAAARNATITVLDAQSRAGALASMVPARAAAALAAAAPEVRAAVLGVMMPRAAGEVLRALSEAARTEALIWMDWEARAAAVASFSPPTAPTLPPRRKAMNFARHQTAPPAAPTARTDSALVRSVVPSPAAASRAAPNPVLLLLAAIAHAAALLWERLQEAAAVDVSAAPGSPRAVARGVLRGALSGAQRSSAVAGTLVAATCTGEREREREDDASRARRAELLAANRARWLPFLVLKLIDVWTRVV